MASLKSGLVALVVAACSSPAPHPVAPPSVAAPTDPIAPPPASAPKPRLVVLLVIDQLPAWAFEHKRGALAGGFDRLLREGDWHTGVHPSAATLTASGHALLGTGEPVSVTGIVGNEWWDRPANRVVRAGEDEAGVVGPRWLAVPGIGDSLAAAGRGGKAVGVALKNRAAVLPLGRTGQALHYDAKTAAWRSTAPAPWLDAYAASHPITPRLKQAWTPLDPERLAKLSGVADAAPGEIGEKGFGPTFPHAHLATKQPADAVYSTPLGNELTLELALAAIDGEQLGRDDVPDYLSISLSPHDYVGHGWGHESWEAWDLLLRLDAQLAEFLTALDAKVGADRWAMVVTSDHGASPMPATHGGGAITKESIKDAANRAAITQLGAGDWIAYANYPTVYLSAAALARSPQDRHRALIKISYALRAYPGIARVGFTSDVAGDCARRTGDDRALCLGLHAERSGEVYFLPKPYWIFDEEHERLATAHGSLHAYDREVPVIVLPPGRQAHAARAKPSGTSIPMTRIAPLLASYLGVTPPAQLPR